MKWLAICDSLRRASANRAQLTPPGLRIKRHAAIAAA